MISTCLKKKGEIESPADVSSYSKQYLSDKQRQWQEAIKTSVALSIYHYPSSRFHLWAEKHRNIRVVDRRNVQPGIICISMCVTTHNVALWGPLVGFPTGDLLRLAAAAAAHPACVTECVSLMGIAKTSDC